MTRALRSKEHWPRGTSYQDRIRRITLVIFVIIVSVRSPTAGFDVDVRSSDLARGEPSDARFSPGKSTSMAAVWRMELAVWRRADLR